MCIRLYILLLMGGWESLNIYNLGLQKREAVSQEKGNEQKINEENQKLDEEVVSMQDFIQNRLIKYKKSSSL